MRVTVFYVPSYTIRAQNWYYLWQNWTKISENVTKVFARVRECPKVWTANKLLQKCLIVFSCYKGINVLPHFQSSNVSFIVESDCEWPGSLVSIIFLQIFDVTFMYHWQAFLMQQWYQLFVQISQFFKEAILGYVR